MRAAIYVHLALTTLLSSCSTPQPPEIPKPGLCQTRIEPETKEEASRPLPIDNSNTWNQVVADANGKPVKNIDAQLNRISKEIELASQQNFGNATVMVFAHGGLVSEEQGRAKAEAITRIIKSHYSHIIPLFLIWKTEAKESYGDELDRLSDGDEGHEFLAPINIAEHFATGIIRVPVVTATKLKRVMGVNTGWTEYNTTDSWALYPETNRYCSTDPGHPDSRFRLYQGAVTRSNNVLFTCKNQGEWDSRCATLREIKYGEKEYDPTECAKAYGLRHENPKHILKNYCLRMSEVNICDEDNIRDWTTENDKFIFGLPFRVVTNPLLNGMGQAAWTNMLRRTRNTVRQAAEFKPECMSDTDLLDDMEKYPEGTGVFARLFHRIRAIQESAPESNIARNAKVNFKLTLIGHSMGAIVFNELLDSFPNIHYDNIVYMAAAASITDVSRSVTQVMRNEKNKSTRFFNLMLHPHAEAWEMNIAGTVPTGSLLKWIDEVYGHPLSPRDKTAGTWGNVRAAKTTFPVDVQERMIFKVFGLSKDDPLMHAHFSQRCFWDSQFWVTKDLVPTFWDQSTPPDSNRDNFKACTELMNAEIQHLAEAGLD